jgi:MFS family permease
VPEQAVSIASWRAVPRDVWALGFVSLFMDVSSELIHSLLPLFLVDVLGTSTAVVGVIEGVAEATAAITRVFSGALSDRLGKRKLLAVIGYGLGAVSKPIFPLAGSATTVLAARFIDRVGKGVRTAPRDALVADVTAPEIRGAAYGLRQALDSIGALAGPLLAVALMAIYADDFRAVLWWAVVPAAVAVGLLVFGVREPAGVKPSGKWSGRILRDNMALLGPPFWQVVGIGFVFALARFSEAFLVLKGQAAGLPVALVPLVMVWMNVVYAAVSTPAGALSDRIGRRRVLISGLLALIAADAALAVSTGLLGLFVGVGLWGLHMGLSQGLLSAFVADTAPVELRGTAFGIFNLLTGISVLLASALAGVLWDKFGPTATFEVGGMFAGMAAIALTTSRGTGPKKRR